MRRIIELLGKADTLRHRQRYDAARIFTDEALAIDPQHPWARATQQVLEERKIRNEAK